MIQSKLTEAKKIIALYKRSIFSAQSKKQLGRFLLIYVVLAFLILGLHALQLYSRYSTVAGYQASQIENLRYWENVIAKHPNFPDAYYNAALIALELNMKEKAVKYAEQAIYLDPGFVDAEKLKKQLSE